VARRRSRDGRSSPGRRPLPINRRPRAGPPRRANRLPRGTATSAPLDAAVAAELRHRAEQLARQPTGNETPGAEVIVCRLGGERYAIELAHLAAIQPSRGLTPIPCTPGYVAGALNVRGEVVTVLDLAVALGLPPATETTPAMVLLLPRNDALVGLLVEDVLGIECLATEQLHPATSGHDFVRGIADGATTYLDLDALLTDERFELMEEVN
jgi:purine-binding chemotaxis protein CheW